MIIIEAILKINPNAVVSVSGNELDTCTIEWLEGTTPIPKADIEAKMVEVQAEYDSNQYHFSFYVSFRYWCCSIVPFYFTSIYI